MHQYIKVKRQEKLLQMERLLNLLNVMSKDFHNNACRNALHESVRIKTCYHDVDPYFTSSRPLETSVY